MKRARWWYCGDHSTHLMQNYGNIDVYIKSGLQYSEVKVLMVRHGGFLATQRGTLVEGLCLAY